MSNKQVLVLQDLGINKESLQQLITDSDLPFEFVFDKTTISNNENIEGIITIKEKVGEKLINIYPNVKFIAVAFTGYDCVDMEICREKNIAVYNVPAYSTDSVAELTLGLTISLLRDITYTDKLIRSGSWNHPAGIELKGKKIGIVGTGTIGLRVAEIFKVMGCELYAWSRSKNPGFTEMGGIYISDLKELCAKTDIITIHIPQNKETINLIHKEHFEAMKPSAFIINTARGPIVNQNDLTEALKNKMIAGAGIDVYDQEPVPKNLKLLNTENSILLPHIAFKTKEALVRRAEITLENIQNFLDRNDRNRVG